MCSYEEALDAMKPNLVQYQQFTRTARQQLVDIIVFPEDGLTGFEFSDAAFFMPFTQFVPDNYLNWNPCLYPGR